MCGVLRWVFCCIVVLNLVVVLSGGEIKINNWMIYSKLELCRSNFWFLELVRYVWFVVMFLWFWVCVCVCVFIF